MNWHFIETESREEIALRHCGGSLSVDDGYGYGICYGDNEGDGFSPSGRDDYGDGYDYGDGDGDGVDN